MSENLDQIVQGKAQKWLDGNYDSKTKDQVKYLMENDKKELTESFYKDLEFGTGGLRGIMGVGTNRMNVYTVGMATQGLANYLKKAFPHEHIKVAIGHDSRNNSRLFSEQVASIFAANGFKVYLFDSLRPTPELSFAIRRLGCQSGVVITASHNPKEYNGYKAYWADGAQVTPPHDKNIIAEVEKITSPDEVLTKDNITILDETFDEIYLDAVHGLSLSPEAIAANRDMKIVYTPLHGTGVILVPASLRKFGFRNIITVKEQNIPDGNFPTVVSPNPEERATMKMALDLAAKEKADLVLATDPDADRIGVAIPNENGEYILLNGNQTCALLTYYLIKRWSDLGRLDGKQYIIKTIVTTGLINRIAEAFGVKCFECLTGFKYIGEKIAEYEKTGQYTFLFGYEESYGFLSAGYVRDKDAVAGSLLISEMAAYYKSIGTTLYGAIHALYLEYGYYGEAVLNVQVGGVDPMAEMNRRMTALRGELFDSIAECRVLRVRDYLRRTVFDLVTGATSETDLPESDVLYFELEDGTNVIVRPSGTEPKIKVYILAKGKDEQTLEAKKAAYAAFMNAQFQDEKHS